MGFEHEITPIGIDKGMTLTSIDLLAGVIAARTAGFGRLDALAVDDCACGAGLASSPFAVKHDQGMIDFLKAPFVAGRRKPAFDLIDPGCRCWREMHMIVRPPRQPCPDCCRFVGRLIVHDDVDIEILGDLSVDLFNEVQKFGGPMPLVTFADDKPGGDVERCEQRGRAMTD